MKLHVWVLPSLIITYFRQKREVFFGLNELWIWWVDEEDLSEGNDDRECFSKKEVLLKRDAFP